MSHDLTLREDGRTEFFSAITKGWHELGQLADKKLTAMEAMEMSLLNWPLEKVPVMHEVQTPTGVAHRQIPDKFLMRRGDNQFPLGVVSSSYESIDNLQTFSFIDEMIGTGRACWDTAGSLAGGRVVFMQIELEGNLFLKSRPDDKTLKKVLFFTSHDGSKAFTGMVTPIRVVCQNTLNAALGNHSNCFKIKHTKNWEDRKSQAAKILGLTDSYFDDLQAVMDTLESKPVDSGYLEGFVNALFPSDKVGEEVAKRTETRREEITDLFYNGQGNLGKTRWDLWNATTEYVDHHALGRMTKSRTKKSDVDEDSLLQEARFERSIFGSGAALKQKSLDLLLS